MTKADILFCDYYEEWIAVCKKGNVRDVTLQKYYQTLKSLKSIAPELKIGELNRSSYQNILNVYAQTHEKVTTSDFNTQLKSCISDIVEEGILEKNPTKKVVLKGKEPREKKIKYLNQFETQCLIRTLDLGNAINYDYFILLLIKTGLRFSEALGLTPKDFDFDNQTITVNKTWDYKNTDASARSFAPTKTGTSVRTIWVDWKTLRKFQALIENIPPQKPIFLYGIYGDEKTTMYNSTLNAVLERRCRQAQIPVITAHALRHTHVSLLLAAGASMMSVSKRLGHADTVITQRVYAHLIKELENKDNGIMLAAMMNLGG